MKVKTDSPGYRLRQLRLRLGKTQQTFADEMGVSGSTLSRYEKNLRGPDVYFYYLLNMKTGVDLNWLLCGKGEMFYIMSLDLERGESLARDIITQFQQIEKLLMEFRGLATSPKG